MKKQRFEFAIIILLFVSLFVWKTAQAESTYNFYFNPEGDGIKTENVPTPASQEKIKVEPHHRPFRLGVYYSTEGSGFPDQHGLTLTGKYFPWRFGGIFTEGTFRFTQPNNPSQFKAAVAAGIELYPISLSLFLMPNAIEMGGEAGWGSLHKRYEYWDGDSYVYDEETRDLGFFAGPKLRLNFHPRWSVEGGWRVGEKLDYGYAGVTLNL